MLQLKFYSSKRTLDLPIYSLSKKEKEPKSCFINSTRIDTVKPAIKCKKLTPKKKTNK